MRRTWGGLIWGEGLENLIKSGTAKEKNTRDSWRDEMKRRDIIIS